MFPELAATSEVYRSCRHLYANEFPAFNSGSIDEERVRSDKREGQACGLSEACDIHRIVKTFKAKQLLYVPPSLKM
jgi:hypothetical protein